MIEIFEINHSSVDAKSAADTFYKKCKTSVFKNHGSVKFQKLLKNLVDSVLRIKAYSRRACQKEKMVRGRRGPRASKRNSR